MTSSDLTPTSIVDKNGKQTTVHKRQPAPSAPKVLAGLKPTASPSANHADRLSMYVPVEYMLKEELFLKERKLSHDQIGEMLDDLHPDTLIKLAKVKDDFEGGYFLVQQAIHEAAVGASVAPMNNLALFYDGAPPHEHERRRYMAYVNGLANPAEFDDDQDFSKSPESVQRSMKAVLKVTLGVTMQHYRTSNIGGTMWTYLSSNALAGLVMERPEDADRIITILTDRPKMPCFTPDEVGHLRDMLDQNVAAPLAEGIL
jgi:hypothetical protein